VLAGLVPGTRRRAGPYGDQLAGKVVVDITNSVDPNTFQPLTVEAGSAAQAGKASGAKVNEAFNTTFAGRLAAVEVQASRCTCRRFRR
jgi:predicted dinucleotide-binding enzyme